MINITYILAFWGLFGSGGLNDSLSEYALLQGEKPSWPVFSKALEGYQQISQSNRLNPEKQLITIIDFNLPSDQKRMWIIDLDINKTLVHSYVAHGRNTGSLIAEKFSNISNSYQSSLGFYLTNETYFGRNGFSLRLDGLEKGINDNARKRAIVMHGAQYAEESFIAQYGRLGRSYGCPAVPASLHKRIIDLVKNKTVIYIHHDSEFYSKNSRFVSSEYSR